MLLKYPTIDECCRLFICLNVNSVNQFYQKLKATHTHPFKAILHFASLILVQSQFCKDVIPDIIQGNHSMDLIQGNHSLDLIFSSFIHHQTPAGRDISLLTLAL